jgi:proteasome activator subunit 3 (PA28 gamma)
MIKYPGIQDYPVRMPSSASMSWLTCESTKLALEEHDRKQLYFARQHLFDLRHIYAVNLMALCFLPQHFLTFPQVLTDIVHKNIAKIRAPKANNAIALY